MAPYSLLDEPWLPVQTANGAREFIQPKDLSRSDLVKIATGRPDCDISLTEFLIGLLAVATPPEDDEDWLDRLLAPPTAEDLAKAFHPLAAALMLDGDGPRFFQDRENLTGEAGPISGLLIDAPGAQTLKDNADHFVKRGQTMALSRAGAAIVLATLQTSAPSGGAGHRTSLRGGGPLTTLVMPGNAADQTHRLWRLLWANVAGRSDEALELGKVFPWLLPTRVSDKSAAGVATTPQDVHPLQAFFGMPRRIRLNFESNTDKRPCDLLGIIDDLIVEDYVTRPWGTNYVGWSLGHPLSPYYKAKPADLEFLPVHLKSSRVAYRDWLGLAFGDGNTPSDATRRPAQCVHDFKRRVQHLDSNVASIRRNARLLVAGYAMDNMKPLDFGEALMPLIVASTAAVNEQVKQRAKQMIDAAQETATLLVATVRRALFSNPKDADTDSTLLLPIRDRFWAETEQDFFNFLRDASIKLEELAQRPDATPGERAEAMTPTAQRWLDVLRRTAERIFDDSVPIDDIGSDRIGNIVAARKDLLLALRGFGPVGGRIFASLDLPPPERASGQRTTSKAKKARTPA